jgi:hypothetical protein
MCLARKAFFDHIFTMQSPCADQSARKFRDVDQLNCVGRQPNQWAADSTVSQFRKHENGFERGIDCVDGGERWCSAGSSSMDDELSGGGNQCHGPSRFGRYQCWEECFVFD